MWAQSELVNGAVRAFAATVGITVGDKLRLKQRLNDVAQGMMYHAIAKRRGTDLALFGLVDGEMHVFAGLVSEMRQFFLEVQQMISKLLLEPGSGSFAAFVAGGFAIG
jgi:hypothetical protein